MTRCTLCGTACFGHECSYCGHTYCGEHRLPERHYCRGARDEPTASGGDATAEGSDAEDGDADDVVEIRTQCVDCGAAIEHGQRCTACIRRRSLIPDADSTGGGSPDPAEGLSGYCRACDARVATSHDCADCGGQFCEFHRTEHRCSDADADCRSAAFDP